MVMNLRSSAIEEIDCCWITTAIVAIVKIKWTPGFKRRTIISSTREGGGGDFGTECSKKCQC